MKLLIVNADDFGFTHGVNRGIVDAHRNGILTATTLMANGAAFDDAVQLAGENPSLEVGVHGVLVGGHSVAHPERALPGSPSEAVRAILSGQLDPEEELDAQVRKILDAGLQPVHMDTHKHTHLFPPVLKAVARVAERYSIRWIRRPFDLALPVQAPASKRLVSAGIGMLDGYFRRILRRHARYSTNHFFGFQITGRFGADELCAMMERLPEGSTEFMCHPGHCDQELEQAPTRLRGSRVREMEALCAPETGNALRSYGIQLASYRSLKEYCK